MDELSVAAYLDRIGAARPARADGGALRELQLRHLHAVPFENLSIHLGEEIVLEEQALHHKVVARRRGGFCYELNGLFAALLRELGFKVTLVAPDLATVALHPVAGLLAAQRRRAGHAQRPDADRERRRRTPRTPARHGRRGAGGLPGPLRRGARPGPVSCPPRAGAGRLRPWPPRRPPPAAPGRGRRPPGRCPRTRRARPGRSP